MFTDAHGGEDGKENEGEGYGANPSREASGVPPDQQNPSHVQRRNGIARSFNWQGLQYEMHHLLSGQGMPREILSEDVDGAGGWNHVVEKHAEWSGDEKRQHDGESILAFATKMGSIHQCERQRQSYIKDQRGEAKP